MYLASNVANEHINFTSLICLQSRHGGVPAPNLARLLPALSPQCYPNSQEQEPNTSVSIQHLDTHIRADTAQASDRPRAKVTHPVQWTMTLPGASV